MSNKLSSNSQIHLDFSKLGKTSEQIFKDQQNFAQNFVNSHSSLLDSLIQDLTNDPLAKSKLPSRKTPTP